ncbi:pollen-specific leucine-rich repeat extensin-like protein 4 [Lucilia sericata]|uniref:pollen-specific leucine-rich repeat extensin-like protein 4 n=1 Tax=Lucilia sericata TaxID=13632 RepID=UPI0018A83FB5|nr:pollen-specific leucine-rich repeat extensin-like protein 4 [Lucilia sericata]
MKPFCVVLVVLCAASMASARPEPPRDSYAAPPSNSYSGPPSSSYSAPSSSYAPSVPSGSYGAPQPVYGPPQQPPVIHKHVYVHVPPPEPEYQAPRKPIVVPPPQKHYKIVFIKAPSPPAPTAPVIPQLPQTEEKTLVYVLVKKPEEQPDIVIPTPAPTQPSKPEVYFIRYKTQKEESGPYPNSIAPAPSGDYGAPAAPSAPSAPSSSYGVPH